MDLPIKGFSVKLLLNSKLCGFVGVRKVFLPYNAALGFLLGKASYANSCTAARTCKHSSYVPCSVNMV